MSEQEQTQGTRIFCDICKIQHTTSGAETWCPHCEEALCSKCQVQHGIQRLTKKHETMPISDYEKLPEFIRDVKQHCEEHDERFEYFCSKHDLPCCVKCIRSLHRACSEAINTLQEAITNPKSSKMFLDLEKSIEDLKTNFKNLLQVQGQNLEQLQEQKVQCQKEIKERKEAVLQHLDKIEDDLLNELNIISEEHALEMNKIIKDIESREQRNEVFDRNLSLIKLHASDLQCYMSARDMSKKVKEEEQYIQSLIGKNKILHVDLIFHAEEDLVDSTLSNFGKVAYEIKPEKLSYINTVEQEAQIFAPITRSVDEIRVMRNFQLDIPTKKKDSKIHSCITTDSGDFILAHLNYNQIEVFNSNGTFSRHVLLPFNPNRMLQLEDELLISCSEKYEIKILDKMDYYIKASIKVHDQPLSLAKYNECICIGITTGFRIINKSGDLIKAIPAVLPDPHYTAVKDEKIYYTNWKEDKVTCIDMTGQAVLELQNEHLKAPLGICFSLEGHIFVSGFKSNNVMVFSECGKHCKEIIRISEDTKHLRAIHFNSKRSLLLISTEHGKGYVYESI